jgi:hypothetical protein
MSCPAPAGGARGEFSREDRAPRFPFQSEISDLYLSEIYYYLRRLKLFLTTFMRCAIQRAADKAAD